MNVAVSPSSGPGMTVSLASTGLKITFIVEDLGIGADQAHMRIGFEAGHLTGQLFGPPQVVAVQKGHRIPELL